MQVRPYREHGKSHNHNKTLSRWHNKREGLSVEEGAQSRHAKDEVMCDPTDSCRHGRTASSSIYCSVYVRVGQAAESY